MKGRIALGDQLAAAACLAVFAGSAVADNGKNPPGSPPGNSENAPGQQKKADPPPQRAPASPQPAAPAVSEQRGQAAQGKPDRPAKPDKPAKPEKASQQPATSSSVRTSDRNGKSGNEKTAHDRSRSATRPDRRRTRTS
jgi:hypothetical protein